MPRRELLLESCEERILCDAVPDVALQVPTNVKIGETAQITATFDNASPTDAGFGPYIDLALKTTGADGAGAAVDDGVSFINATYLGAPVTATTLTFNAAGQAIHPYAKDTAGNPAVVQAPAGFGEGDQLIVLQLPFGSFTATQPPAQVLINLQTSNLADVNVPLGIAARGGFQYGNDALDNPATDPSIIDGAFANASITPALFTLNKVYLGPEDETATGPNFPRQYRIDIDIAAGQTISNLQINDLLPPGMQFVSVDGLTGGTENTALRVTPGTTAPGGTLSRTLNSVTGTAATTDASLLFTMFVPRVNSGGAVIVDATSGDDVLLQNNASVSGTWTPIDSPRDPTGPVSIDPTGPEHILTAQSISTQKTVSIVKETGALGASPGDTLEYTIQVQISDYFAFQNLNLSDLFSDGQRLDPTFTPTFAWTEHNAAFAAQGFNAANYTVTLNADNNVLTPATDGSTALAFNLSAEMIARGQDGKLLGGGIPNAGTGAGTLPNNAPLPFTGTTATIRFRTIIQDKFTDTYPSGNASLDPRDVLTNNVSVRGDLLQVVNATAPTGQSEADTSSATVTIVNTTVSKTIYAINGNTDLSSRTGPAGQLLISPGDALTYRLQFTVPTGDVENLFLNDYLPQPVFNATQVTAFQDVISAAAPAAGVAKFGPAETLRPAHGSAPTLSSSGPNNRLTFNYGTTDDPANLSRTVDLLFTVTAGNTPFADGLFLTNQVQVSENNTQDPATVVTSNAIIQVQLQEPGVSIFKGVVGYGTTSLPLGGITFTAPGAASNFSGGPIDTAAEAAAIGASDLPGNLVDAGDAVRFAVVLQNTGRSDAFDVSLGDQVVGGYNIPASLAAMNFTVRRGDGTLLTLGTDYTASITAGGAIALQLTDNYTAGNVGTETGNGGLSRGQNANNATLITNGSNTVVVTYDLTLSAAAQARSTLTNTATLTRYAGANGGTNFIVGTAPTESASVTVANASVLKTLTGTEINTAANSNTQAVVGELVTYTLTLTLPEGTTPNAAIADTLDAGLAFVGVTSVSTSAGLTVGTPVGTGTAPANVTVGAGGQNVTFNFGTITNANTNNAAAETITIVYQAVVLDALTNQTGAALNNSAVFSAQYTDQPAVGAATPYSLAAVSANNVTLIEPTLTVGKTVSNALGGTYAATLTGVDAGDAVFYRVQIAAAAGPTAFDLFLSDTLPTALTGYSIASVATTGFGGPAPTIADFQIVGGVLSINPAGPLAGNIDVPGGATLTITLQGALVSTVNPAQNITNNATVRWTSLDGDVSGARSTYSAVSTERSGGALTPAANTNASTNNAILDNYAATSANATVTILNPTPAKTIDATSEPSTGLVAGVERVAIGEIVRYRLVWQIPEGVSNALAFTDQLPAGMQFLNDGTAALAFVSTGGNISSSIAAIGAGASVAGNETTLGGINPTFVIPAAQITGGPFGSGTDPVFNLGNVTNPDSDGTQEFVVIEFNAIVLNVATNQDFNNVTGAGPTAVNLLNSVRVATSTSSQTSANVTVRVAEPAIVDLAKTVSVGPYDAGNTVTYTVTFSNVNSADASTAFDVAMADTLPAFLTNVTLNSVTLAGGATGLTNTSAGNTVAIGIASMAPGATVTVTYTAQLVNAVPASQIVTNTARVTYTSLPGNGPSLTDGALTSAVPGASGTTAGERSGAGGEGADAAVLNNFADSAAATLTVAAPTLDKTFKDGSLSADDTNIASTAGASVVVGEQVTYDILVTLPEGVTRGLSIIDAVPTGLRVDSYQILTTAAATPLLTGNFNGSFAATPTLGAPFTGGANLTISFGDATLPADNAAGNNSFVIRITATVLNILANQGGVIRTNTATLQYTNPNTGTAAAVADANAANDPAVAIVEPALTTLKTVDNATPDTGDAVTYTITISNTSGQTAYDVALSDALPTALVGLTIVSVTKTGSGTIFVNGAAGTPTANGDVVISGGVLQFSGGSNIDIGSGATLQIVVSGTVGGTATPNQTVANTATSTWTSTDGADADERTGANGPGPDATVLNNYASSGAATFTVPAATFAKQLFATSEASTTGSNVTIGETVTYALIVTLPEGTTPGLNITDLLPAGLQYVSASIVTTAAGSGGLLAADFNGTLPAPAVTGGAANGDDVNFAFGTISVNGDNVASNNRFLILVTARVLDVGANSGVNPPGQTVLSNSASFDVTGDGIAPFTSPAVNVTVVEPKLGISKDIVQATGDAGNTLTITLTASNTGASATFDTILQDTLDLSRFNAASVAFVTTAAGFTASFNSATGLVQFSGGTINAGNTATFTFTAALRADLQPGQTISNSASITQATTLPGPAANERNEPTVSASDSITVPKTLTLVKTLLATSEASTAGSNVAVGETATFRLTLGVQEGVTPEVNVTDAVPVGLAYVGGSAVFRSGGGVTATGAVSGAVYTDGSAIAAADIANSGSGGNLVFRFVNVTAPATGGVGTAAFQIDYTLLAQNVAPNQGGVTLTNSAAAASPTLALTTAPSAQTLRIVEPTLSVTKTLVTGGADAGDPVQYTITITNASGVNVGTAFDINVLDALSANLVLGAVSVSGAGVSANGTAGNALNLTLDQLAPGASATITVNATVAPSAPAGATVGNSTSLTYTSTPGANANERNGSGGINDYAAGAASANFTLARPQVDKLTPADTTYSIGEFVSYNILVTLPEGVTQGVIVRDALPAGLVFTGVQVVTAAGGALAQAFNGTVTGSPAVSNAGGVYAFNLGDITTNADNAAGNNRFVLAVTARVADVPGNVSGTVLVNSANLGYTDGTNGASTVNDPTPASVSVVEPVLNVDKTSAATVVDGGQVVTYTVTVTHTGASTADAFDLSLNDLLDPGLTLVAGSVNVTGGTATVVTGNAAGDAGVNVFAAALALGQTLTFTYQATVDAPPQSGAVAPGGLIPNTVSLVYDSLPGPQPNSRGGSDSDNYTLTVRSNSLSGFSYIDADNDGVFDGGEAPQVGVTITLTGKDSTGNDVSLTMMTGADGSFSFANLRPSDSAGYTLTQTQNPALLDGRETAGSVGGGVNNAADSNAITGIVLPAGAATGAAGYGFGDLQPASIAGAVYVDANNDGVFGGAESGVAGVAVTLTGTDDRGASVSIPVSTLGSGVYNFTNLRPGSYTIAETQPAGYRDGKDTLGGPGGGTVGADQFAGVTLVSGRAAANYNFGELRPSGVSGVVFIDTNNNGAQDPGETGIANVTLTLTGTDDLGNAVNLSIGTGLDGSYAFPNLRPGAYTLSEAQPAGLLDGKDTLGAQGGTLGNDTSTFTLGENANGVGNNFGELQPASLSGFVYNDANNDGIKGGGETGVVGVAVALSGTDDLGNPVALNTLTVAGGAYSFGNLRPGTYTIAEAQPAGLFDGKDAQGTPGTGTAGNDVFNGIALGAGVNGTDNNFGELSPSSLSGFVYVDANNDGVRAAGEPAVVGATITLNGTDDLGANVSRSTNTLIDGSYSFINLRPGTYTIAEAQPAGLLDGKDAQGTPGTGTVGNDVFTGIALASGTNGANNNFGELRPASVSGTVFIDTNNDGAINAGENGVSGVTLTLTGTDDLGNAVNLSIGTGLDGSYAFPNLRPGAYTLSEAQPAGFLDGKDTLGAQGGALGNDTSTFTLGENANGTGNNFGELQPASLSGKVFVDANNNGAQDPGETGIVNVALTLTGTDDLGNAVSLNAATIADGSYNFLNLRPGTYTLAEIQPAGFLDGKDTQGTPGTGTAGNDVFTGITLAPGVSGVNNNFGELGGASIAGTVFLDGNNDGAQAVGETGIVGVTVTLSGTDDLGANVSRTAITDGNGGYSFLNLRPGVYSLAETQPAGLLDGKDQAGSAGGAAGGPPADAITGINLASGVASTGNTFGELSPSSLSGSVYADADNDGVRDPGEAGIMGVAVFLSGTDDLGNAVALSMATDSSGAYSFGNLRPGAYTLSETQPTGYLDGRDAIGTPGGAAANDSFSGIALGVGVNGANNNFSELSPASLSGGVYVDANNDGARDASEAGILGVTITLTGTDDLGANVSQSTNTDSDGNYSFINLRPGAYTLAETQPAGLFDGKDAQGTPGTGTAGSDVFSGIALASGTDGVNNNFGELRPASVSGTVFIDANNDGAFNVGENGVSGVTLTLTGTDDLGASVNQTVITDANGSYAFGNLRPGTYTLTETQPAGLFDGKDTLGAQGGVLGNDASTFALGENANGTGNNFGELRPSSVSGMVFIDTNNDGLINAGENGVSGVGLSLTGTDDLGNAVNLSTVTDGNGAYSFGNLRPGTYTIAEAQPTGLFDGKDTQGTPGTGTAGSDVFTSITLASGIDGADNNFGELQPASLSGAVFADANNNSAQDPGEPGIAGVTITLTGTDDLGAAVNLTGTTNAAGGFSFPDLRPGSYAIAETQPAGYGDGADAAGTLGGTVGNDAISAIPVTPGADGSAYTFAETRNGITGTVFVDADRNGALGSAETGLGGVTVTLRDPLGNVVATTTTATDGTYFFDGLVGGNYTVIETPPAGYGASTPNAFAVTVPVGGVSGVDFGATTGSLSGAVFRDDNNNAVRDGAEPTLGGVIITLTGIDAQGAAVNRTTVTAADGSYSFTGLIGGAYTLVETQPAAYGSGQNLAGAAGGTVQGDTVSGIALGGGQDAPGYTFGERGASLLGTVYFDANKNGARDPGEPGIGNVTMELRDGSGAVVGTALTAADGSYRFENLAAGDYTLTEIQPGGYASSTPDSRLLALPAGGFNGADFGDTAGSLSGRVYVDSNGDGQPSSGEPGIPGVKITLTGTDANGAQVSRTTITDAQGNYTFADVLTGAYRISETQPPDYDDGPERAGTAGGSIQQNDRISGIALDAGTDARGYAFGELVPPVIPPEPPQPPVTPNPEPEPDTPVRFAFDSFNNFAFRGFMPGQPPFMPGHDSEEPAFLPGDYLPEDLALPGLSPIDIWRPAVLPLAPIYSGEADPGATLVVELYNANGEHIASQTVLADAGGNWLANFGGATLRDTPSDVRIVQTNAPFTFGAAAGRNLRTYYAPSALNPGHFLSQSAGPRSYDEPAPLLQGLDLSRPISLGPVKYGLGLLPSEGTASGD